MMRPKPEPANEAERIFMENNARSGRKTKKEEKRMKKEKETRNEEMTTRFKAHVPGPVIFVALFLGAFGAIISFMCMSNFHEAMKLIENNPDVVSASIVGFFIAGLIVFVGLFCLFAGSVITKIAINRELQDYDVTEKPESLEDILEDLEISSRSYGILVGAMRRYLINGESGELEERHIDYVRRLKEFRIREELCDLVIDKWEHMHPESKADEEKPEIVIKKVNGDSDFEVPDLGETPKKKGFFTDLDDEFGFLNNLDGVDLNPDDFSDEKDKSGSKHDIFADLDDEIEEAKRREAERILQEERANDRVIMERYIKDEVEIDADFYNHVVDLCYKEHFEVALCMTVISQYEARERQAEEERQRQAKEDEELKEAMKSYLRNNLKDVADVFFDEIRKRLSEGFEPALCKAVLNKHDDEVRQAAELAAILEENEKPVTPPTLETVDEDEEAEETESSVDATKLVNWYMMMAKEFPALDHDPRIGNMEICYKHSSDSVVLEIPEDQWQFLQKVADGKTPLTEKVVAAMRDIVPDPVCACLRPEYQEAMYKVRDMIEERIGKGNLDFWKDGDVLPPPQLESIEPDEKSVNGSRPIPKLETVPEKGTKGNNSKKNTGDKGNNGGNGRNQRDNNGDSGSNIRI